MDKNPDIHDSISQVQTLLTKHQLLTTLADKQNRVELQKVLDQLPPGPIARILESLPAEDRQFIWQLIPDAKKEEILLEADDAVRVELLFEVTSPIHSANIRIFDLHEGRLRQITIESQEDLAKAKPIWVDLVDPEDKLLSWASGIFGVELPDPRDITDLETSARLCGGQWRGAFAFRFSSRPGERVAQCDSRFYSE